MTCVPWRTKVRWMPGYWGKRSRRRLSAATRRCPRMCPIGLSDEFARDAAKRAQWKAFLGKNRLDAPALDEVIAEIRGFVDGALKLARQRKGTP